MADVSLPMCVVSYLSRCCVIHMLMCDMRESSTVCVRYSTHAQSQAADMRTQLLACSQAKAADLEQQLQDSQASQATMAQELADTQDKKVCGGGLCGGNTLPL